MPLHCQEGLELPVAMNFFQWNWVTSNLAATQVMAARITH
jgi:hypothetical protein